MNFAEKILLALVQTIITFTLIMMPILGGLFFGGWGLILGFVPIFSLAFWELKLNSQFKEVKNNG